MGVDLQRGRVVVTCILTVGAGVAARFRFGMKPESNPAGLFMHGVLKVDSVKVWLSSKKVNTIVSPILALTKLGTNSLLRPPTVT